MINIKYFNTKHETIFFSVREHGSVTEGTYRERLHPPHQGWGEEVHCLFQLWGVSVYEGAGRNESGCPLPLELELQAVGSHAA